MPRVELEAVRILVAEKYSLATADLPASAEGARWISKRKAAVVAAVSEGLLTIDEACGRYALTLEEFVSWQSAVSSYGRRGLRITKLQDYRPARRRAHDRASFSTNSQGPMQDVSLS